MSAVIAATLVLAPAAQGAVTVGGNTAVEPDALTGCGGSACTLVQISSASVATSFVVPIDGVLVRWRIRTANGTGQWRIRTVADAGSGTYTGSATGAYETVVPGAERTFAARVPVEAGTLLGVDGPASATAALGSAPGGGNTRRFNPPLVDDEAPRGANAFGGGFSLQYNADIEADADGDGYGDETQDACPTNASTQGACPDTAAPQTTITKGAPKRTDKRKVRFKFVSDEPGSTFECKKDKKPWRACSSPTRMKRLKQSKHRFKVRATDAAGNTDLTPAKDRFRVVG